MGTQAGYNLPCCVGKESSNVLEEERPFLSLISKKKKKGILSPHFLGKQLSLSWKVMYS